MLLHLIADFGPNDLAFAEVIQRFKLFMPEAEPVVTPVPPFATLAAGFCAAQLALNDAPPGTVVFHNVAPRQDEAAARRNNDGERLACARLPNRVVAQWQLNCSGVKMGTGRPANKGLQPLVHPYSSFWGEPLPQRAAVGNVVANALRT